MVFKSGICRCFFLFFNSGELTEDCNIDKLSISNGALLIWICGNLGLYVLSCCQSMFCCCIFLNTGCLGEDQVNKLSRTVSINHEDTGSASNAVVKPVSQSILTFVE